MLLFVVYDAMWFDVDYTEIHIIDTIIVVRIDMILWTNLYIKLIFPRYYLSVFNIKFVSEYIVHLFDDHPSFF